MENQKEQQKKEEENQSKGKRPLYIQSKVSVKYPYCCKVKSDLLRSYFCLILILLPHLKCFSSKLWPNKKKKIVLELLSLQFTLSSLPSCKAATH